MMFDSKDFLQLIQEGKISPDTITADFTKALNEALATKKQMDEEAARKKAEEEAQRKREELKAALEAAKAKTKMREADDIAARLTAFIKTHYAEMFAGQDMDDVAITGAQIVETLDGSVKMIKELMGFQKELENLNKVFQESEKKPFKAPTIPKDPITEFLRSNNLI